MKQNYYNEFDPEAAAEFIMAFKESLQMLRYAIVFLLCLSALAFAKQPQRDMELLAAIIQVESGGDPKAKGLAGEIGILQIQPILVKDVNRIIGQNKYTLADRYSPEKSIEMFWIYTDHYLKAKKLPKTTENIASLWNAGPKGPQILPRHKGVQRYVAKIKRALEASSRIRGTVRRIESRECSELSSQRKSENHAFSSSCNDSRERQRRVSTGSASKRR